MNRTEILHTLQRASERIASLEAEVERLREPQSHRPVAIIGTALRFPGASNLEDYWSLLTGGGDAIGTPPAGRFKGQPRPNAPHFLAGYLAEIARFDAALFAIAPDEARHMDPQQRHLLELSFAALLDAGIDPFGLEGERVGVFLGLAKNAYGDRPGAQSPHTATGGLVSSAAGRIAFHFGLRGPAMVVDTACSSALASLHLAVRSLRERECDLALVGASNLILSGDGHAVFAELGLLSPDGRSRAFEARAAGFGRGEGAAVVVLKRADEVDARQERALAIVDGTALGHDGRSAGLTAPSRDAQVAVVRAALADAGRNPNDVAAVETHGTGTRLGDTVEAEALGEVFGGCPHEAVPIGSAKAVLGHLEHAAGMASLLKAVLVLRHAMLPAQPEFETPNPAIPWASLAITPAASSLALGGGVVGVSGFGISGTNAHAVLSAAPAPQRPATSDDLAKPAPLLLSAPTRDALQRQCAALSRHLQTRDAPLGAVARQLATRHVRLAERAAIMPRDRDDAIAQLSALAQGRGGATFGRADAPARNVFVFAGQGAQWPGMGRALLAENPLFRATIAEVAAAFGPLCPRPLEALLGDPERALVGVREIQPALFAMQVGLAALWREAGVEPDAVVGHSMGEFAAAAVCGALSLQDAAFGLAERARIVAALAAGRGAMASVELPEDEAAERIAAIAPDLQIAVVNSPTALVVSGRPESIATLVTEFDREGRFARRIEVDYASHSAFMRPLIGPVSAALSGLDPRPEAIAFVSSVTGDFAPGTIFDGAYAARGLAEPVRFGDAVAALVGEGYDHFIEVGPHPVLGHAIEEVGRARARPVRHLPTLTRDCGGPEDFSRAVAASWTAGASPNWHRILPAAPFTELPAYVFGGEPLWLEPAVSADAAPPSYGLSWGEAADAPARAVPSEIVVIAEAGADGEAGADRGAGADREALRAALSDAGIEALAQCADFAGRDVILQQARTATPLEAVSGLLALLRGPAPASITILTSGATSAFGPPANAAGAALIPFANCAAAESPEIAIRAIDSPNVAADAAAIVAEIGRAEDRPIAVHGRARRHRVLSETALPATPIDLHGSGAHVVTGGLSGVGLETVAALVEAGARSIATITRRPAPADGANDPVSLRLAELRAAGATIACYQADVADRDALTGALQAIRQAHGGIASVSHAAGSGERAAIADLDGAGVERVFAAKLSGAQLLAELTAGDDLAFTLFHSSIAALFRSPGQAAYASANAGLDALAASLTASGRRTISIAWPVWRDVGVAAREGFATDTAFLSISAAQGRRAISDAIALKASHIIAAEPNLQPAMVEVLRSAPFALSDDLAAKVASIQDRSRGDGRTVSVHGLGPAGREDGTYTATERALANAYGSVLGVSSVDVFAAFFSIGGNSIHAARIVNRLKQTAQQLDVALVDVLRHQTIAELAAEIDGRAERSSDAIARVAPAEAYRASAEQRRFWFQHQTARDPSVFNLTSAYRLEAVDADALDRALVALMERHEPLRTTLHMDADRAGVLVQRIEATPASVLERIDLSGEPDPIEHARARTLAEASHGFDIATERPFRAVLMDAGGPSVLCLTVHHAAADGWGLGVFTEELDVLYRALRAGGSADLAPLAVTYKDYAAWQADRLASEEVAAALDTWATILSLPLPVSSLRTDHERPKERLGRGATRSFALAVETSDALDRLAAARGATPSMAFLALLAALLHTEGGDTDVVIGVPTAGRSRPELEGLVGNFLGTLPLRLRPAPDVAFADLLEAARTTTVEAFAQPEVPLDLLLDRVAPPRHAGHNPLFDVMLLFQNHKEAQMRLDTLTPLLRVTDHAKVDLTFEVRRHEEGYDVVIEYDTALFEAATIARLFETLAALAANAVRSPQTHLGALLASRRSEGERRAADFAAPLARGAETTAMAVIARQAAARPDAIAMETAGGALSYAGLVAAAEAWAAAFARFGAGAHVAIAFGNDPRQVTAMLGAWWAGAVPMPFDPAMASARRDALFDLTRPVAIAGANASELPDGLPVIACPEGFAPATCAPAPRMADDPDADAYVFPTSGSTGAAKAVLGRHGSLAHFIEWQGRRFGIDHTARCGFLVGFTFDASLRDILLPLMHGGTLVVPSVEERSHLGALATFLARARLTVLHTVPSVLRPLTERSQRSASRPRFSTCSSPASRC